MENKDLEKRLKRFEKEGMYHPQFEKDACGVGLIVNITGKKSHAIVEKAIEAVVNLVHRGAVDADKAGDGAGILIQVPQKFFREEAAKLGAKLAVKDLIGVGMIFFPKKNQKARDRSRQIIEEIIQKNKLDLLGWREVPVDAAILVQKAAETSPQIEQALIGNAQKLSSIQFEQALYLTRKEIEKKITEEKIEDFYIPSFSHKTLVYKGLFVGDQLKYYKDLLNPKVESALAILHQRYSTNTFPNWYLAQSFRLLAHNGEINTLRGNVNWMRAREADLASDVWGDKIESLKPLIQEGGSDSAALDNVLEALVMSGHSILHAITMLMPEAYQNMHHMDPDLRAFYEYHACKMEPWDGPAAIAFTDGTTIGARLDRNGLRPARYIVTDEGLMIMGSEVGMLEVEDAHVVRKGRLGPGQMIAVDTDKGLMFTDEMIKEKLAFEKPYKEWVKNNLERVASHSLKEHLSIHVDESTLLQRQVVFGYSMDDLIYLLKPTIKEGKEPVGSMGDDTPLAVMSKFPRALFTYFKQLFAQVTNPAIDPIREHLVFSLNTAIGKRGNLLEYKPEHAKMLKFPTPILFDQELHYLLNLKDPDFQYAKLDMLFEAKLGPKGLKQGVQQLCDEALKQVEAGKTILVLTDRKMDKDRALIPVLLAVGAVHHHLIRNNVRMHASIVVETGEAREVHHFATLIGYGASLINPYLALETIASLIQKGEIEKLTIPQAFKNFRQAMDNGLYKIMSKMGISSASSYRGAQIFDAIGLADDILEDCFAGTPSKIKGISYEEIAQDYLYFHNKIYNHTKNEKKLDIGGFYRYRGDGEYHSFNPAVFKGIHKLSKSGDYQDYKKYVETVYSRDPMCLRDMLEFSKKNPISIDEVESIEAITRRFTTSPMSLGALSPEAHETLAIAMNRIGGRSNSGEGGEDPKRFVRQENGDLACSKTKQVASGRFGVTPEYLVHCDELQIKIAQGSKPGEGGQLPGDKVTEYIAYLRHSTLGVTLISPPPHHDIYSIEDLSQLIYDLKQVNPKAKINVKLVSETGVGTVAAGVAKGHADVIMISGHEGGTGASPLSSIKNAGSAWELGLAEAQQVLVLNDLRGRVTLQTDGGLKTGRDIVVAALLGAEEYGFGTTALVAEGCVMARQCHSNTCPVGIATQREDLRAKYTGTPDRVVNFFNGIAQEVREYLAELGYRSLDELIGRVDLLKRREDLAHHKLENIDLSPILFDPDPTNKRAKRCQIERNELHDDHPLDEKIIADAKKAIETGEKMKLSYPIRNIHRSVGTQLSYQIASRYGDKGLADGTIQIDFKGRAGQSFGAFNSNGVCLTLEGDCNDYVGKGMAGGQIIVKTSPDAAFNPADNVIIGNTVLYGATGGALFANGRGGERFAVRNSGAWAVVEGIGDHGCEYMTGGIIVVLGETGRNFGAGMTGGAAFIYDAHRDFPKKYNDQLIGIHEVKGGEDVDLLKLMLKKHVEFTGSKKAQQILEKFDECLPFFWKVAPLGPISKPKKPMIVRTGRERHLSVPFGE